MQRIIAAVIVAVTLCIPNLAYAGREIMVFAAASLSDAFRDIGASFEADNPGVKVVFNFAASGALMRQMELGAPADVLAAADMRTMEQAQDSGLVVKDGALVFASNTLLLVQPSDSRPVLKGPEGLLSARVERIAVGNPRTVPAGGYAKDALELAGVWERVGGKLVLAENVRQVLDYVRRGEVDAGIVYSTDAASAKGWVRTAARLYTASAILYPAAIASGCRDRKLAVGFVKYLTGKKAAAVLKWYGFGGPKAKP